MKHSVFGRKLSRTKNERRRLFAGLVRDMLIHDRIVTSIAKAKAVQPLIEKIITKARAGGEANRRRIDATLTDRKLTATLMEDAKTRFAGRTSGFTRIIKVGKRLGDATDTAMLSFVDERVDVQVIKPKKVESAKAVQKEKKVVSEKKVRTKRKSA